MGPRGSNSISSVSELQHRNSAKLLINRYESLDSPAKAESNSMRKFDKSPVRQSFRNLLGFLKKANPKLHRKTEAQPTLQDLRLSSQTQLLYLSHQEQLAVWKACTATLASHAITLSFNSHDDSDRHVISLAECSDVRSVTTAQLPPNERDTLPYQDSSPELRVFEIIFDHGHREKFAADTVRERANWVSSIWGEVIPFNDSKSESKPGPTSPQKPPAEPASTPHQINEPTRSRLSAQKALPACPLYAEPSSAPGFPSSTSIVNLTQRSMVKERLAQIQEVKSSALPAISDRPTLSSQTGSTNKSSSASSADAHLSRYYDEDSIVDSYCAAVPSHPHRMDRGVSRSNGIAHLIDFFQDQTTKQYDQGASLGEQVLNLQHDVQKISQRGSRDSNTLQNIQTTMNAFDTRMIATDTGIKTIRAKLEEVAESVNNGARSQMPPMNASVKHSVDGVLALLDNNLPLIKEQLACIVSQITSSDPTTMRNVAPEPKTDDLASGTSPLNTQVAEILRLSQVQTTQQGTNLQQQGESVQYLHDLNSWLEAFVVNTTKEIREMHVSINQIHADLKSGDNGDNTGLIANLGSLVTEVQDRDRNSVALQGAIQNLTVLLSQRGMHPNSQSIIGVIDRQRHEQDSLLRAVATELSNEIRGERLRFIEAMKDATAINVQTHVNEFKKELQREVQGMTATVDRLYQERQTMENQIADLFAFYSKQKKSLTGAGIVLPTVTQPSNRMQYSNSTQSYPALHRELPNPYPVKYKRVA